ncbi:hypothetical protein LX36DRAFT_372078 [Colletotrichum falcatum]|nr:hypothetical protein LX36DRAFT_372078 [Colletotrichum falcatum]
MRYPFLPSGFPWDRRACLLQLHLHRTYTAKPGAIELAVQVARCSSISYDAPEFRVAALDRAIPPFQHTGHKPNTDGALSGFRVAAVDGTPSCLNSASSSSSSACFMRHGRYWSETATQSNASPPAPSPRIRIARSVRDWYRYLDMACTRPYRPTVSVNLPFSQLGRCGK